MPAPRHCMELTFSLHSSWDGWHVSPSPTGNSIFCNTVSTGQWWKCLLYSPEADITPSPPNALHDVYCGQECGSKKFNVHHHILTTPHLYPSCALPLLLQQELLKDAPRRCFFLKTWVSWNDFQLRNNTRGSTTTHGVQQQHTRFNNNTWGCDLMIYCRGVTMTGKLSDDRTCFMFAPLHLTSPIFSCKNNITGGGCIPSGTWLPNKEYLEHGKQFCIKIAIVWIFFIYHSAIVWIFFYIPLFWY